MCNEDGAHPAYHLRDARTCAIIQAGPINGADTGRCVAGDISASSPGAEMWSSSVDGAVLGDHERERRRASRASQNFLIWWDADETRELEDGTSISKYGGSSHLLSAERLRVEQRHQVDADADRRSARRLARGDHLARERTARRCASTRPPT